MHSPEATVFVVDDEACVRTALARLLVSAGYEVETFASAAEFLSRSPFTGCGCIVVDLRMPGLSGLDLQQSLSARCHMLPLIFISGHAEIAQSVQAMKAGALNFLPKPFNDSDLLQAVAEAVSKSKSLLQQTHELGATIARLASLTPRERQVFDGVVTGKLNKQIAADLGTVEKTVKVHRSRVMQKMGARSLAELVRMSDSLDRSHGLSSAVPLPSAGKDAFPSPERRL